MDMDQVHSHASLIISQSTTPASHAVGEDMVSTLTKLYNLAVDDNDDSFESNDNLGQSPTKSSSNHVHSHTSPIISQSTAHAFHAVAEDMVSTLIKLYNLVVDGDDDNCESFPVDSPRKSTIHHVTVPYGKLQLGRGRQKPRSLIDSGEKSLPTPNPQ